MGVEVDGRIVHRRVIREPTKVPPTTSPARNPETAQKQDGSSRSPPMSRPQHHRQMNIKLSAKTTIEKWGNAWAVEEDIVEEHIVEQTSSIGTEIHLVTRTCRVAIERCPNNGASEPVVNRGA